jgi:hypothetical protein
VAAAAFVVFGGVGLAKSGPGKSHAAQGQYGKKVVICHKGKRTLRVSVSAWPAHRRHGDALGTCAQLRAKLKAKKLRAMGHGKRTKHGKAFLHGSSKEGGHGKGRGHGRS